MEPSTAIRYTRHLDATAIPAGRRDRADSRRLVAALRGAGVPVTGAAVHADGAVDLRFDADPGAALDAAWASIDLAPPPDPKVKTKDKLEKATTVQDLKSALLDLLPDLAVVTRRDRYMDTPEG